MQPNHLNEYDDFGNKKKKKTTVFNQNKTTNVFTFIRVLYTRNSSSFHFQPHVLDPNTEIYYNRDDDDVYRVWSVNVTMGRKPEQTNGTKRKKKYHLTVATEL